MHPLGRGNGVGGMMETKAKGLLVLRPFPRAIIRFCVHGKALKAVLMNRSNIHMFRALKRLKLEKNSSERGLAILASNRPPEPSPVKRRTGPSGPPPSQFQVHNSGPSSEISTPTRTSPVFGRLSSPKRTKAKTMKYLGSACFLLLSFL